MYRRLGSLQGRVCTLSCVQLSVTPWTVAQQAPLSMGFPRQEYRSGLPSPTPGDLLNPGMELTSHGFPALAGRFFTISPTCHCCSIPQSCLTVCDPMDCSTPGFPVLHHLPEFTQTYVHWAGEAIQPFHSLLPSSPPALNLSQHQSLFQWVGSLHLGSPL